MKYYLRTEKRILSPGAAGAMALLFLLLLTPAAQAASTWDGGGEDSYWSSATNWLDDVVPTFPAALTFGESTRLAPTNDLTDVTVTNLAFAAGAGAFTLRGNAITLGGNVSVGAGGSVTNNQTIDLPITLGTNTVLSAALVGGSTATSTKGALVINGVISGPFGLTSSGRNYVQLNGANTYTGNTIISSYDVGGSASFSIGNASAFGSGKLIIGPTPGSGTHWVQSVGNITLTNDVEIRTSRFVPVNYTIAGKAPGNLTLSGNVVLNHGSGGDFWCQRPLTLSGTVSGSGLRMAVGTVILTGANTFTDDLRSTDPLTSGPPTFNINSDAAMGHTNNGVQAVYNIIFQTADGTAITLAPSRSFTINAGRTNTFDIPSTSSLTIPGPVYNNGTIVKSGSGALSLSGTVANSGGITLNTGTLTLSGVNTYSGSTTLKGGTLALTTNAALGSANNPLTFTTAATLQAGATNVSLAASRAVTLTNAGTYTATFDVPTNFTLSVAGTILGNGTTNSSLNKTGAGTLILTGGSEGTALGGMYVAGGRVSIQSGIWSVAPFLQADGSGFYVSGGAVYEQTGGTNTIPIYAHICNYPPGSSLTSTGMLSGGVMTGMELMVGRRGNGTLTVSGTALLDLYSLKLGESTNYTSTVNLDGGVIACYHIASRGTNSALTTSILNLNGGTIRAKGVAGGLIGGYGSGTISYLTQVNVKSGGAIIDSQANAVTIPQVLEHAADLGATPDGGLTKRGSGSLTLSTTNTYTGVTAVEGGTLKLNVSNTLWAGGIAWVASNAVLDVNGKAQTLAALAGSGTVTNNNLLAVTMGVAPGSTNAIGTLTLAAAPAALAGTLLVDVAANGDCDRLHVRGDLNIASLNLSVANPEVLNKNQKYVIASYTGALTDPFLSAPLPDRWHVKSDTAAREVYLSYDFGSLILLR